ncbi:hemagglutinin repeat-containing protein [Alcanivorax sp. NBRC 102024]|uniref:two-partner secretion domain-containing protein n=1 Tax=Alcanivorax sp. NBRC 102024 TaxID=1113895 RepID=UPI000789EDC7|nr:hemagglutinin repeat-containing protein [Alcanivorax sp. NBRC 102024]
MWGFLPVVLARVPNDVFSRRLFLFARQSLVYGLSLLLIWQPMLLSAQPITPTHGTNGRPTLDQAANGVPVVNIQNPNGKGVSQNFYNDLNVSDKGLVLNNSQKLTQTQLGGYIEGNPNLKNGSASLILNEVIGQNPSNLAGYIEVGGARADVVVANPNGISCNGCGFINTNHATLTTGKSIMEDGELHGFDVQGGAVSILGNGLNASNTERFDIIARSVTLAGELHADSLNIVTGQQKVDRQTLATSNATSDGDKPQFAIDSSALGGMYANRIRLIANEDGVGVKLDAPVAAQNGDLQLSANGNLRFSDASAQGDIQLASAGDLISAGNVAAGGYLSVDGRQVHLQGGEVNANDITVTAEQARVDSGVSVSAENKLKLAVQDIVTNHGDMLAGEMAEVTASDFTNTGKVAGQGHVVINATDSISNSGQVDAVGDLTISTADLNNTAGALRAEQTLSLTTGHYVHQGEVQADGALQLDADTVAIGAEADWQVRGDVSVTADQLRNEGVFSSTGDLQLAVIDLENQGDIAGLGSLTSTGEILRNGEHSLLLSAGNMGLYLSELDNKGDIYAVGDMDIAGGQLADSVDAIWKAPSSWADRVRNTSGLIASGGNTRIAAHDFEQKLISDPEVDIVWDDPDYHYDRDYDRRCFNRNRNSACHSTTYRTKYQKEIVQSFSAPRQSRLLAGNDLWLLGDNLINDAGVIAANNDINIKATRFENTAYTVDLKEVTRVDKSWLRKKDSGGGTKKKYYTYTTIPTSENWYLCDSSRVRCNRGGARSHTNIVTETIVNALVSAGGTLTIDAQKVGNGGEEEGAEFSFGATMDAIYGDAGEHSADTLFRFDPLALGFDLPGAHGLFILSDDPGHLYLIETNPLFATLDGFLGSEYLLDRLGLNPNESTRRLGDSYYETTLIRDAVLAATGTRFLDPDFESDEEQYRWLMDNALVAAESLELSIGVSLTADQINALQQDIVWLEEKEVAGHQVLVPVLYLAQGSATLDGPQLQGENVLIAGDDVTNHGGIVAENDVTINAGQGGITNTGTIGAGKALSLESAEDIQNLGGALIAKTLSLDAENDVVVATLADAVGDSMNWMTRLTEQARLEAETLSINSGGNTRLQGAQVNAGLLELVSDGDLAVESVAVSQGSHMDHGDVKFTQSKVRQLGTTLDSSLGMLLAAENDLSIMASDLNSEGDIRLQAKGDITVGYAAENDSLYSYRKDDGSFGSSKKQTTEADSKRVVGSNLMAMGNLILNAEEGDIEVLASKGHGEQDVEAVAGGGIRIESAVNSEYHRTQVEEKNAARIKTRDTGSMSQTLAQAGLSSGADLSLDAQGDVVLGAAQLEALDDLRIGDAALATAENGALRLDDDGNPIIERGSIDNLYIGTVALENENWDVRTRSLRGPVKELAKASSALMGVGALYMPGLALAGKESEIKISESTESRVHQRREVGSTLQAENIQLSAENDMTLTGSSLEADEESGKVVMLADNILLDTAVTETTTTERNETETASSIDPSLKKDEVSLGGLRLTELEQSTVTNSLTHSGSSITGNQIVLEADNALSLINADINATGEDGVLSLAGETVEITGVQDEQTVTDTLKEKTTETTVGIRNAYVDAAYAVEGLKKAVDAVDDARDDLKDAERRVERGELAKEALEDYRIMLAAASANLVHAELASTQALAATAAGAVAGGTGFYVSGSAQHSETTSTSTATEKTWQGSSLNAAAMSINADKAASIIGSEVNAGVLDLNAADILIGAGTNEQSSRFEQESKNGGFSVSTSGAGSWNANAGFSEAESESQATQYVNSQLNVGHLNSTSDSLTVKGGVVTANTANIDTGTLHIESLQDTHSSSNSSVGANVGIGGGTSSTGQPQSGSAGFNIGKGSSEGARTNQQSTILIADGENSQVTAKDTTLIGGMIANASYEENSETGELALVDHGNLNFSTDTLTVEDLRDYSKSDQQGGGLQLSKATTTISVQDSGHRMEGQTRATIGGGNVTVGGQSLDDKTGFASLNRDVSESQVVTLDQQTGALNANVTVDNRVFSEAGRTEIVQQHKDLKNNAKATIGGAGGDLARIGVVVGGVVEASQIGNALDKISGSQAAAYHEDGKLAGDIEGVRDGEVEDAQYAQDSLNDADKLINGGDGDRVKVTDGAFNPDGNAVAGAANTSTNTMYLDLGDDSRSSMVNTLIHEGMHLDGAGEPMSGLTGFLGDLTYRLNAWANSDQISQHKAIVPVMNPFRQQRLLSKNWDDFVGDAENGELDYRFLNDGEHKFIDRYGVAFAAEYYQISDRRVSIDRLKTAQFLLKDAGKWLVDDNRKDSGVGPDKRALDFIVNSNRFGEAVENEQWLFVANDAQKNDAFLNMPPDSELSMAIYDSVMSYREMVLSGDLPVYDPDSHNAPVFYGWGTGENQRVLSEIIDGELHTGGKWGCYNVSCIGVSYMDNPETNRLLEARDRKARRDYMTALSVFTGGSATSVALLGGRVPLSLSAPDFAVNVAKVADSYFTDGKDQAFIGALGMGFGKLGGRAASSAGYGSGGSSLIDFTYPFIFDSAVKDLEDR